MLDEEDMTSVPSCTRKDTDSIKNLSAKKPLLSTTDSLYW